MGDAVATIEKERVDVVAWSNGCLLLGEAAKRERFDAQVRVRTPLDGFGVPRGLLVVPLVLLKSRVIAANGIEVEVQRFRYVHFSGEDRSLVFCAWCGDCATVDSDDLVVMACEGCRKCGASVAPAGCFNFHTFGSCLRCPGSEVVPMPPGGLKGSPPEGPAATELSLSHERRVVPCDPEGNEVAA